MSCARSARRGDAGILHALKLDGAAAAEADQDVAIERGADGNAVIVLVDQIREAEHVMPTSKSWIASLPLLLSGKVDEGVGAIAAFERVVAADALAGRGVEIGIEDVVARPNR